MSPRVALAFHAAAGGFAALAAYRCSQQPDSESAALAWVALVFVAVDLVVTGARIVRSERYGWAFVVYVFAGALLSAWLFPASQ